MPQTKQQTGPCAQEAAPGAPQKERDARARRLAVLALADEKTLEAEAAKFSGLFSRAFLRRPEAGLVMLEGRAGNTGRRFNLGEMLITRCMLRLEPQGGGAATEGCAFIQGDRPRKAELVALFDALLQQKAWAKELERSLLEPLAARREKELQKRAAETAPTRVEFFTLVRGEDA